MDQHRNISAEQSAEQLVWAQNVGGLLAHERVSEASWAGAVQSELAVYGVTVGLSQPRARAPAFPLAAIVMMIKDEADIIGANLRWLHYIGVRRFIINDNGSTDGTFEVLQDFRVISDDTECIIIDDPIIRHIQAEKQTAAYRMACAIWPDLKFVFPIDADEFIVPAQGLERLLDIPSDVDALTIPKVIHFRYVGGPDFDPAHPFPSMALRNPMFCVPPKIALRPSNSFSITQGNHQVDRSDGHAVAYAGAFSYGLYYREFQTRSFQQFVRKVINGGRAILDANARGLAVGGEHWMRWYRLYEAGGEEALRETFERDHVREAKDFFVFDEFPGIPPTDQL